MGFLSTAEQSAVLNFLFAGGSTPFANPLYMGLATDLSANGTITGEPTGNNYARKSVAVNGTTIFGTTSNGVVTNNGSANGGVITFNTASGNWGGGALSKWFLSASSSGGTWIIGGALTTPVTVVNAQAPTFAASQLSLDATGW